jgi:Zn-dependent protease with chaperone function
LLLGVFGVGSIVVISAVMVATGLPQQTLPTSDQWHWQDLLWLAGFIAAYNCVMLPLDFLGGYFLPRRYKRSTMAWRCYCGSWVRGTTLQAVVFLGSGSLLLAAGRMAGTLGAGTMLVLIMLACLYLQENFATSARANLDANDRQKLDSALLQLWQLGLRPVPVVARSSHDVGFTGGIVGMPGRETSIVPESWLHQLSAEELTVVLARRSIAVSSESRTRGIVLAVSWVVLSFVAAAWLCGDGVSSVAGLVMTLLGSALFNFLGLLILPVISRQASYAIDRQVIACGVQPEALMEVIEKLDRVQDDEPERSPIIESIFHPVPSVANRKVSLSSMVAPPTAWHAARMTIFLSWAGVGLLSRAVHCNVGRPDLWVMLPTD